MFSEAKRGGGQQAEMLLSGTSIRPSDRIPEDEYRISRLRPQADTESDSPDSNLEREKVPILLK